MKLVLIESPYAGDVQENLKYARECLRDSIDRGEAPFASHLLYTQVLNDEIEHQRKIGIGIGLSWGAKADLTAVYMDRGVSRGMAHGIQQALLGGRSIVRRWLDGREEEGWDFGG